MSTTAVLAPLNDWSRYGGNDKNLLYLSKPPGQRKRSSGETIRFCWSVTCMLWAYLKEIMGLTFQKSKILGCQHGLDHERTHLLLSALIKFFFHPSFSINKLGVSLNTFYWKQKSEFIRFYRHWNSLEYNRFACVGRFSQFRKSLKSINAILWKR